MNTSVNAPEAEQIPTAPGCLKVSLVCVFRRTLGWRENGVILILQGRKETIWTCLPCPPARARTDPDRESVIRRWPVLQVLFTSASVSSPSGWHCAWCFNCEALREVYYMVANPTLIKILGNYFSRNTRVIIKKPYWRKTLCPPEHNFVTATSSSPRRCSLAPQAVVLLGSPTSGQDSVTHCLSHCRFLTLPSLDFQLVRVWGNAPVQLTGMSHRQPIIPGRHWESWIQSRAHTQIHFIHTFRKTGFRISLSSATQKFPPVCLITSQLHLTLWLLNPSVLLQKDK